MQQWPALNGSGHILVCPACSAGPTLVEADESEIIDVSQLEDPEVKTDPAKHFRQLISHSDGTSPEGSWPEPLLEDLPEETRKLLSSQKRPPPSTKPDEISENLAQSLRSQGYVIGQDAHGVRISGDLIDSDSGSDTMSPYDVVRLAADLEGGVLPLDERIHCLKCDAVILPGETNCQWCGELIPPHEGNQNQD
jgi:hypothetical protein